MAFYFINTMNLKIRHANIRSLYGNFLDVTLQVDYQSLDIMCFPETWLDISHPEANLQIPGYRFFREDRSKRKGGGVAGYIINALTSKRLYPVGSPVETLFLEIRVTAKTKFLLVVSYSAPNQNKLQVDQYLASLQSAITLSTIQQSYETTIVVGDFNGKYLRAR